MIRIDETLALLTEIRKKVIAGTLSRAEANQLAVLALQEVIESIPEAPAPAPAEEPAPAPAAPAPAPVEPKSVILAALTKFEQTISPAWKTFQNEINAVLMETSSAAVPLGDFSIDAAEMNAKVTIAQQDTNTLLCTYRMKNDWPVSGIELANPITAETACHLGLRQQLLAVAGEVLSKSRSTSSQGPIIEKIRSEACSVNDLRVIEATAQTPSTPKGWENWALGTLTLLLGSDYLAEGATS